MAEEQIQWDEDVKWDQSAAPQGEKGLIDRAKDVATSAGFGGVAGAFTPEIAYGTGQVLEKVPYKPVQMAGRALKSAAPSMMGAKQRAVGSLAGGFSGATGETAGQVAELAGAPAPIAESARILGSLAPVEILSSTARGVSGLLRSVSPTAANTRMLLRSVMDDVGAANLAGAKREEVMSDIGRISGPMLADNLLRQDVDLAFDTDLLYLDVYTVTLLGAGLCGAGYNGAEHGSVTIPVFR